MAFDGCNKVYEMAQQSLSDEHKLMSNMMFLTYYLFLNLKPKKILEYVEPALGLYKKVRKVENK